jgi:hypothetical protein
MSRSGLQWADDDDDNIDGMYVCTMYEELDGLAVSALGVRSRKLSNALKGQS